MTLRRLVILTGLVIASGCNRAVVPAALDTTNEPCGSCRMIVSDARTASQIVAPLEEPRFFDDLGCLASYMATVSLPASAVVFVADHRTLAWVPAETAVYTQMPGPAGAMGSRFIAHASAASRAADRDAAAGILVDRTVVFQPVKEAKHD